jgi:menaquinone-dependent protoporphyrinogen oxidase
MTRVLVAYGSKHGGTAAIAAAIGKVLAAQGCEIDVVPAREVDHPDAYDAVVLGSGVYVGRWQGDAMNVLKRHERTLASRPTWLFSSGPTGGTEAAEAIVRRVQADPTGEPPVKEVAKRAERIGARGHATFGGWITPEMGGIFARWMPRGDWRDFAVIERWAAGIAGALVPERAPA